MTDNHMKDVLESIAQRNVPEDVNLWPQIAANVERKNFIQTVRTRPALALLLVVLALALLSSVAYAIGKVTGYIPGVGLVNQTAPLRILAESVKVKQAGITITIRRMVTDADHTSVTYRVDGIPYTTNGLSTCDEMPALLLPNGSTLSFLGGGNGSTGSEMGLSMRFETTVYYSPIPTTIDHVTIVFPCILPKGAGPENWQILLNLSPVPEGYVLPAVEIGATFVAVTPRFAITPTPTSKAVFTPTPYNSSFPATPTPVLHGSGLYLEQVVELDTSYLLIGNFSDIGDLPGSLLSSSAQQSIPYEFRVTDRNGKPVSFSFRPDLMPQSNLPNVTYWALEVRKPLETPITITLPEVTTMIDDSFQLPVDVGSNPVIGQTWGLSQPVKVDNYSFMVESLTCVEHGYTLKLRSPLSREKVFVDLQLENYIARQRYERFYDRDGYADFTETIFFKDQDKLPAGSLTFTLHIYVDNPIGPWTLTWTPPNK